MFISCGKHGCEAGWKFTRDGEAKKCSCLRDYQKSLASKKLLKGTNLPTKVGEVSLLDYTPDQYIGGDDNGNLKKVEKYCESFKDKFNSYHLYFWARSNSTQKTTTAAYIGKQLAVQGYKVQFVIMDELVKKLTKVGFEDVDEEVSLYLKADFLIIDDAFDPAKVTLYKSGYQISFIDNFLRKRLEGERKATCFTSNIPIPEIISSFGKSIHALVLRCIYDPMEFKDSIALKNDFNPQNMWD